MQKCCSVGNCLFRFFVKIYNTRGSKVHPSWAKIYQGTINVICYIGYVISTSTINLILPYFQIEKYLEETYRLARLLIMLLNRYTTDRFIRTYVGIIRMIYIFTIVNFHGHHLNKNVDLDTSINVLFVHEKPAAIFLFDTNDDIWNSER